ncbi:energy transducer TonB [Sphingomonas sp. ac-8]|uniref:energy transducer TonB family protein n=1 Tax=Sphingomonas sp. ac-8 TaxID=3242977 RepID=UPI003A80B567
MPPQLSLNDRYDADEARFMTAGASLRRALPPEGEPAPGARTVSAPAAWERSCYADQPVSLSTRLLGAGGVAGVAALLAGAALLSWTALQTHAVPSAPALAMFDVAPPAPPPAPARAVQPDPEPVEKVLKPLRSEQTFVEPPAVRIPTAHPIAPAAAPSTPVSIPLAAPPVTETTAPEAAPLPPAATPSNAAPNWRGHVLAALNKVRRYPRDASFRRQQGVPYIRFTMSRSGKVLSVQLERSSGVRSLDREAMSLPKRAQPLPKPPEAVQGETIELVVPVEFYIT